MDVFNLSAPDPTWDGASDTPGYGYRVAAIGPRLGASLMGGSLYELPPGEKSFPYHYELGCEEWLIVVAGRPTLRDPNGERELAPGDVVCFPDGPAGAHQVHNRTEESVRILFVSTKAPVALARFPDSGKTMAWTRDEGAELYRDTVPYWDGE